jgi:hypothetical protein
MAKTKKKNSQQQRILSPENYIRQKSRNLPIVKCSINKDWESSRLANILIVRRHNSGNVTFCCYLVDTNCLGVKDTIYRFNEPQEMLDEYEKKIASNYETKEISYELAHNIIFAGLAFAEDYGFKPHRDFTSVTQYFLEEDDDTVPLIEIHCGNGNGEPVYINNGYETPALQQRIINQLEKTAGKGNYTVYINTEDNRLDENYLNEDEFGSEEIDNEIYNQWYEKFSEMGDDEFTQASYTTLLEWTKYSEKANNDDREVFEKTRALTDIFAEGDLYEQIKAKTYYDQITNDLEKIDTVDAENVPNSLFPTFVRDGSELADDFLETFLEIHANPKKKEVQKAMAKFALKYEDCGAFAYLKFMFNGKTKANKWNDIEKELEKFPDYFMLKLLQKEMETVEMPPEQTREELLNLAKGRTLTTFEMSQFLMDYAIRVFEIMNVKTPDLLEKLEALEILLDGDFAGEKCDYTSKILLTMVRILKINRIIAKVISNTEEA